MARLKRARRKPAAETSAARLSPGFYGGTNHRACPACPALGSRGCSLRLCGRSWSEWLAAKGPQAGRQRARATVYQAVACIFQALPCVTATVQLRCLSLAGTLPLQPPAARNLPLSPHRPPAAAPPPITPCPPCLQPSNYHYYQPLWTLVGGGFKDAAESRRPTADVMPAGAEWIHAHVAEFDPTTNKVQAGLQAAPRSCIPLAACAVHGVLSPGSRGHHQEQHGNSRSTAWALQAAAPLPAPCTPKPRFNPLKPPQTQVRTADGHSYEYEYLVVATGMQPKWHKVKGLADALGDGRVVSNMSFATAPLTHKAVQGLKEGHALFTMPKGTVKCPGAGHKVRAARGAQRLHRWGLADPGRARHTCP